jgi:dihydrodipicolinate synthase/N-acetylneuraminate lyase
MPVNAKPPTMAELEDVMGPAMPIWNGIISHAEAAYAPLTKAWKPSKTDFGQMCLLQHKKRTLLYLTPDQGSVWVAIILGERAFQLAMASSLPDEIKKLLLEARPYAEGRGIRFAIHALNDLASVAKLLEIKTAHS